MPGRIERSRIVTAERGGGRGQRDPALRQRMERDEPVYDDEATPDGVVGRRPVQEQPEQEYYDDSEGYDDGGPIEVDRGELTDADEEDPEDFPLLLPGDVVYAKVHHPVRFDDDPSNFTYGIATRVQEGEAEEDAFNRVETIVNNRALHMAQRALEPVLQFKGDVEEARKELRNEKRGLRSRQSREGEQ